MAPIGELATRRGHPSGMSDGPYRDAAEGLRGEIAALAARRAAELHDTRTPVWRVYSRRAARRTGGVVGLLAFPLVVTTAFFGGGATYVLVLAVLAALLAWVLAGLDAPDRLFNQLVDHYR